MPRKYQQLMAGIISYLPHGSQLIKFEQSSHGTGDAWYCYCYWLKHLTLAFRNGLSEIPNTVAELGPGNSLGMGIAALLSGSQEFYALDVISHANKEKNVEILEQLTRFFQKRAIPPGFEKFPEDIISNELLNETLDKKRIRAINNELFNKYHSDNFLKIRYFVPWHEKEVINKNSVDMIYSNFVLEHVDDLPHTYSSLYDWLKPGGFISHQIDFDSHGNTEKWNEHWTYSDTYWKLLRGKRPHYINRIPCSKHIDLMKSLGFRITYEAKYFSLKDFYYFENELRNLEERLIRPGITKENLFSRFCEISEQDLKTREILIQGFKPR